MIDETVAPDRGSASSRDCAEEQEPMNSNQKKRNDACTKQPALGKHVNLVHNSREGY